MTSFMNKIAFITGGSSGIGLETGVELAIKGCNLVLFARNQNRLEDACEYIKKRLHNKKIYDKAPFIEAMSMDVSDNEEVIKSVKNAVEKYGIPDYLINSAGIGSGDYFENIPFEEFDSLIKINLYGIRNTTMAVLPYMKKSGTGHIVNISSAAGLFGMFGYTLYNASKYAIVGFSEALRCELKHSGINVSLVCPPEVETPFIIEEAKRLPDESRRVKNLAGLLSPEFVAVYIVKKIKRKRFLIIPGTMTKILYFFHRITNGHLTRFISDVLTKS